MASRPSGEPQEFLAVDLGLSEDFRQDSTAKLGVMGDGRPSAVRVLELCVASALTDLEEP